MNESSKYLDSVSSGQHPEVLTIDLRPCVMM
jgi:hypothetical protein